MALTTVITFIFLVIGIHETLSQSFNPAILQDSRDLPKVDGRFGFLYRTEDGIAHAAKGEPGGQVSGRFTYTDPTGLKVNYNYNAGSKTAPGYNYDEPLSAYEQDNYPQKPSYSRNRQYEQPQYEEQYDDGSYREEQPQQQPLRQPQRQPQQPEYDYSQQRRSRPPSLRSNAINNY